MCSCEKDFLHPLETLTHKMTLYQGLKTSFSQLHILVDFEYIFLGEFFDLEIWNTCFQHRDDFMERISC